MTDNITPAAAPTTPREDIFKRALAPARSELILEAADTIIQAELAALRGDHGPGIQLATASGRAN